MASWLENILLSFQSKYKFQSGMKTQNLSVKGTTYNIVKILNYKMLTIGKSNIKSHHGRCNILNF